MINKEKVFNFLDLQALINTQIEEHGQASIELADQLEQLGDSLNMEEIEFCITIHNQIAA
jgi:hypothetical protein